MERWLIVLSLAAIQWPAVAMATPNGPVRLAEAPAPMKSAEEVREPKVQEPPQAQEPSKPAGAACNGGRRVIAASYGQGQRTTSSGERFDPRGMTAAHRTLPFGTRLTVTNLKTGKSVVVVVNDRGPYTARIDIDLSQAAARTIGLNGIAAVCIE